MIVYLMIVYSLNIKHWNVQTTAGKLADHMQYRQIWIMQQLKCNSNIWIWAFVIFIQYTNTHFLHYKHQKYISIIKIPISVFFPPKL